MPLIQYDRPQLRQPKATARINEKHWLAPHLAFVHSGLTPYCFHRPSHDQKGRLNGSHTPRNSFELQSAAMAGAGNPALNGARGWVPNGTNFENYLLGERVLFPLTLSAWWTGINGGVIDYIVGLGRRTASPFTNGDNWLPNAGVALGRTGGELVQVRHRDNVSSSQINVTAGYAVNRWQHGVGVFRSGTNREAYADGGNASGASGTSRTLWTDMDLAVIGSEAVTPAAPCTTSIKGIQLPMIISRGLLPDEIDRLYREQLSTPWELFKDPPIWVPVEYAAAAPTLSDLQPVSVTSTTVQGTYDYVF